MAPKGASRRQPSGKGKALTHFICIPLVTAASRPHLETTIRQFRDENTQTISSKAIRPPGTLHLTLGVMSLSAAELKDATSRLQALDVSNLLGTEPVEIELRGLESMHDPDNTSILYVAPHDASGRLQDFCLAVQGMFKDLLQDDRPLKLHATVVNTIYAKGFMPRRALTAGDPASGHGPKASGSLKFDAREILIKYEEYVWADLKLDRIAICEMGAKKKYDDDARLIDEEYKEVAQIALPT